MKKIFLYVFALGSFSYNAFSQGGVIILEGNYQGKNLYVQNPYGSGGVGFCVSEVLVNGNITTDETNSSAFEIDFKPHKLTIGEKVEIKIKHKEDCKPKVLNPYVPTAYPFSIQRCNVAQPSSMSSRAPTTASGKPC